jgi:rod shape determining protein RodA
MMAYVSGFAHDRSRGDRTAPWRHVDPVLVVCSTALAALGIVMVYSASKVTYGSYYLTRQGIFVTIGIALMAVFALVDYRRFQDYAWVFYTGACILLLLVVSPFGKSNKGSQAWFQVGPIELQPSEFSKICLILGIAALLAHWRGDIGLRRLGVALGIAAVPLALIMLQPDLGTALVFIAIVVAMLLVGGVRGRHMLVLTVCGLLVVTGVLRSGALAQYQQDRLTVFLDADPNLSREGYNLSQSVAAISNGKLTGDGLFQGKQTQLGYVPEQRTDFIFTVVGEELGFVGAVTFLVLMGVIVWRIWRAAALARDEFGQLICVGVLAMLVFHTFESVGMATGIMPVTGIPLPFMSYGGSAILSTFIGIGLVLNVHMRRFR